jgi:peroxiredoxin Q/BCP
MNRTGVALLALSAASLMIRPSTAGMPEGGGAPPAPGAAAATPAAAAPATPESQVKPLEAGDMAPDFALAGSDGKTYHLSDFKGKRAVVVAWFPKAFTGG